MAQVLNPEKHSEHRMRLLSHAQRLFAQQGFKETSMAQVAKACRVTKATLYHYFKSKEAILLAILGCHEEDLEPLRKELAKAKTLEEVFYTIAKTHLEKMNRGENLDFVKILVNEAMTNPGVKKFYLGFIKDNITRMGKEILAPFLKGRVGEVEIRRTYFQYSAALAHFTWQVKMVGGLSDVIGGDEAYIRLLSKVYANHLMNG